MKNRQQLLEGNIWKLMLQLSLPGIAGMVLIAVNGLMDAFFVSHLVGESAFAGVTLALPLLVVNSAITSLLSSGIGILYSRQLGRQQQEDSGYTLLRHVTVLAVIAAVLLALFSTGCGSYLLRWLGAEGAALQYARVFYQATCLGYFPSLLGLCASALVRAGGHFTKVMQVTGVTVLLNLLLHPLCIQGLHLGVRGAAIASILSMTVYTVLTLRLFRRYHPGPLHRQALRREVMKDILLTGLPAFFMQLNGLVRQFILFRLVLLTGAGLQQFSFFAAVYRLFSFAAVPAMGVLQALQPVLGVNYGAGNTARIHQALRVFRIGLISLMLATALPGWLWPRPLLSLLLDGPALHSVPLVYYQLVLLVLPIMPLASTSIVLLQATAQRKTATVITFSRELVLFIPVMYLATYTMGYKGVYYGLLLENVLYGCVVWMITRYTLRRQLPPGSNAL